VARGDAARGDAGPTGAAPTAVDREALPAGREAAKAAPRQVAVGPEPAARAHPRAGRPVGKPAVDQPEAVGRAAAQVEMPAYQLRAVTARVGICRALAGRGPQTARRTG
jgi:hypothetical protein